MAVLKTCGMHSILFVKGSLCYWFWQTSCKDSRYYIYRFFLQWDWHVNHKDCRDAIFSLVHASRLRFNQFWHKRQAKTLRWRGFRHACLAPKIYEGNSRLMFLIKTIFLSQQKMQEMEWKKENKKKCYFSSKSRSKKQSHSWIVCTRFPVIRFAFASSYDSFTWSSVSMYPMWLLRHLFETCSALEWTVQFPLLLLVDSLNNSLTTHIHFINLLQTHLGQPSLNAH